MLAEWRAFLAAWRAQTRGDPAAADPRHAAGAGLVIGGFGTLVLWAAAHLWPAAVAAGVALAAVAALTRARHEQDFEHHFGRVGLVALLGLKAAALYGLVIRDFPAALALLPLAHAVSRAVMAPGLPALMWSLLAVLAAVSFRLDTTDALVAVLAGGVAGAAVARGLPRGAAAAGAVQQAAELALLLALLAALSHA